jgi:hypothetical protein
VRPAVRHLALASPDASLGAKKKEPNCQNRGGADRDINESNYPMAIRSPKFNQHR